MNFEIVWLDKYQRSVDRKTIRAAHLIDAQIRAMAEFERTIKAPTDNSWVAGFIVRKIS